MDRHLNAYKKLIKEVVSEGADTGSRGPHICNLVGCTRATEPQALTRSVPNDRIRATIPCRTQASLPVTPEAA
jgi:hypothetical protein